MADQYQDWDTVVMRKKGTQKKKSVEPSNATDYPGESSKDIKYNAGRNVQKNAVVDARKLEADDEAHGFEHVERSVALKIQQGRQEKGWTQKQLAQAINERANTISEYESGKAIPNPQILSKIERALGLRVRKFKRNKNKK